MTLLNHVQTPVSFETTFAREARDGSHTNFRHHVFQCTPCTCREEAEFSAYVAMYSAHDAWMRDPSYRLPRPVHLESL